MSQENRFSHSNLQRFLKGILEVVEELNLQNNPEKTLVQIPVYEGHDLGNVLLQKISVLG